MSDKFDIYREGKRIHSDVSDDWIISTFESRNLLRTDECCEAGKETTSFKTLEKAFPLSRAGLSKTVTIVILGIICLATATVIGMYFIAFNHNLSSDQSIWGAFGDYLGGTLNPILSFAAFGALLYTIKLQCDELNETRNEIRLSRIAHQNSELTLAKQLDNATKTRRAENFIEVAKLLQEAKLRESRKKIYEYPETFDQPIRFKTIAEGYEELVGEVLQSWDVVGMMVKQGYVEKDDVFMGWGKPIEKSWKLTRRYIDDFRAEHDNYKAYEQFEWLAKQEGLYRLK